uniref:Myosin IXA n=1 Tax=Monopterus albus TaxID=43700 RepID=A0A3Q3JKG4_MONAL
MSARDGVGGVGTLGRRQRFENSEFTVRIYPGDLAEGTIYCPISARKTTTAAEAIERVIDRLHLDRTKCYVLAEVKEFGGEEWILNPCDCPVQRMMLWPRVALEHRLLYGGEDYRFLLRQKNLDGSIHYGGSLQMWLQITEERRLMVQRGLLPHPESEGDHADLCCLAELNERSLLDNLRSRFRQEKIYTYVGSILIVINPFKFLPIYNPKYVKMYDNHTLGHLEPHIYAVADVAYHAMLQRQRNQCIVISGESGSGKTQSTNFLIHHLTALSQKGFASGVEQIILGAGPVLEEAEANAFHLLKKYVLKITVFVVLFRAYVEKYLLEKSRLVYQEHNERNYHVFYYLLAGASEDERTAFHLKKPEEYHYLSQVGPSKSFHSMFFFLVWYLLNTKMLFRIFSLLSAILHLGNIRYKRKTYRDDSIDICNPEVLPVVSELLEVKEEMLFEALTTRKTVTVGEKLIVPYRLAEAGTVRDSMAKSLYSALFDWIVFRINHALLNIKDLEEITKILSIGVLDIFGFEDYESNSFEQFCINFANERLQHYFNQHTFKLEQEEYRAEGISWRNIDYIDNTGCINLISKKPTALFHLLDEECNFPQATNQTLLDKFKRQHEGNSYIEFPAVMEPAFIIRHYAGKVKYGVKDFREKNTDHMRPDIVALLKSSKNAFICGLIGIDPSATFRWAVLRAYFRALVAFREAGKRRMQRKTGHDDAASCAVLKSVDSFSFLQHPVHQRSLEILQRCKEEKNSNAVLYGALTETMEKNMHYKSHTVLSPEGVGRQSRLSSGSSTTENDITFVNSASSKLLERAHDILMRNKNYKSKPVLPKHLLNVKSLKYLSNLTLHDRITKSLLHLHKKKKPPSISAQFQASLNKLMETLGQSEPYFVKCIRSNAEKMPLWFNDNLVLRQLRYTGMLETVRIRQSGYNVKYSFKDFVHHFSVLLPEGTSATREAIQQCLDQLDLEPDGYQVGKTMVFLREAERQRLQVLLHREVLRLIVMLQRRFRAWLERKRFVRMRRAAICIQKWWRSYQSIQEDQEEDYDPSVQEGAVLCLQKHWRGYRERQKFRRWRVAALVLQRAWRLRLQWRSTAAVVIQTAWRCHRAREAYFSVYGAVVQLQALSRGYLARQSFKTLREQRLREKKEQQEELLHLQNGQVGFSPEEEEGPPERLMVLDLSTWEDRSYKQRERSLRILSSNKGTAKEEENNARTKGSSSKELGEASASMTASTVVVREKTGTVDEPSQKTTWSKRASRRMRELEQAKFSLELLKVRATGSGASSPSEERCQSVELIPPATPPLCSPQGTPDSQSSKGSFELLSMDEATEEVTDNEDPCFPLASVAPLPEPNVEAVSTSLKPVGVSDAVAHPSSQGQTKVDLAVPSAPTRPPKIENYLPTFYAPVSNDSSPCPSEEPQKSTEAAASTTTTTVTNTVLTPSVIEKLVRLNQKKEERLRNQQQQNEKEMMEQIRQQKEVLERQRLFFAQHERDMFEKQREEALHRIQQSRQDPLRLRSLLAERTAGLAFYSITQSDPTAPSVHSPPSVPIPVSAPHPQLSPPPACAPKERQKAVKPGAEGWAPKLKLESRGGGGTKLMRTTPKKPPSNQGTTVGRPEKSGNIFFSPKDKENLSPPCSPDLASDQGFKDSRENREPSPKIKRRRSVKISNVALEPAQWQNDAQQILTSISDYRSMNDFLMKKVHDLDTEDSKKDTMVDVVFKKALKEFRLNIFNSYSTVLAMDDSKSIRYKDLHALFEHILEKTMRQEQRDWSESPVKVWVNTFKVFLDEFMTEYKPLDSTLSKIPKLEGKKRRQKDTDIVEEHNGHIFKSTQYSIPTYCEYCSSLIWMMDRACVCKLCRYACHRKCCQKTTTKCSKQFDPELTPRQFSVEVSRLTNDERTVPVVVERLINYIEMHGLYAEGIYRKSGSTNKIKELKQGLNTDVDSVNLDDYNIHVIASVFKQWLRDLPNPLMTFELYEEFIRAMGLQDKKETIRGVYSVIDQLSRSHLNTLERLIFHLVRIVLQEETNRMSANALAIVFAPCILRCPDTIDPLQSVQDISKTTACVELIICEQMNKYKVRLKDISTLEFAENKAKCRLTFIRRSMGKGHVQRRSYHMPSPPVSPQLPSAASTVIESGSEEGAESFAEISEHQQTNNNFELTFEMLALEPRASDDETLESEASIGTADSSENLNMDSEGIISDFSGM